MRGRVGILVLVGCSQSHPAGGDGPAPDADTDSDVDSGSDSDTDADSDSDTGTPGPTCPEREADLDGDCYPADVDCDDADASIHPGAPDGGWAIETIGPVPGVNAGGSALALDRDGRVHAVVASWGRDPDPMQYAVRFGPEWRTESVGDDRADDSVTCCVAPSLAIDGDGIAHLAYTMANGGWEGHPRYAVRRDDAWTHSVIDPELDGTPHLSAQALLLDADDQPLVSYGALDLDVRVRDLSSGDVAVADPDADGGVLALGADGSRHLATRRFLASGTALRYATDASGRWETEALIEGLDVDAGISVDSTGTVHLCWDEGYMDGGGRVVCRAGSLGDWTESVVESFDIAHPVTLVVASGVHDETLVAYQVSHNRADDPELGSELRFAREREDGTWSVERVRFDALYTNVPSSIAVAPDGTVHLSVSCAIEGQSVCHAENGGGPDGIDQDCDGIVDD